jgi:hypothetical protein
MDTSSIQSYLDGRLKSCSHYIMSESDREYLMKQGMEAYLFKKLTSKKFRRTKLPPLCEQRIKNAIEQAVQNNKPIQIILPAGAYKLWSLPSAPEADWAEFFTLAHILSYISPILTAYKPGVQLHFYLFTYLMQKSNNISEADINRYISSFQKIIDMFTPSTPHNISIKIVTDAHFYDSQTYFRMLENVSNEAKILFEEFPIEKKEKYLKSSRLNIQWEGKENWTILSDTQKQEKIYQGALYEVKGGVDFFPKIKEWVFDTDKIIIFPQGKPEFLGIGSTKNSVVKHWVGFGILARKNEGFEEQILSPLQLEKVQLIPHQVIQTMSTQIKNLNEVWVYDESPVDYFSRQ